MKEFRVWMFEMCSIKMSFFCSAIVSDKLCEHFATFKLVPHLFECRYVTLTNVTKSKIELEQDILIKSRPNQTKPIYLKLGMHF